MDHLINFMFDF